MHTGYDTATITQVQKFGWAIEECGELIAALGKCVRWGIDSYNPELDGSQWKTNREWALREISDVEVALIKLKHSLINERE